LGTRFTRLRKSDKRYDNPYRGNNINNVYDEEEIK